jgi:hypothetical protein
MSLRRLLTTAWAVLFVVIVPRSLWACSVCGGDPAAPMSQGMSMGILTLMVITGMMLSGFVAFFMFLRVRMKALAQPTVVDGRSRSSEEAIV